jgi:hypothetical protein
MNRWTVTALTALGLGLGGAFFAGRLAAPLVEDGPAPSAPQAEALAPSEPPAVLPASRPTAQPMPEQPPTPSAVAGTDAGLHYDDSHLYRHEVPTQRLPASAQGVLTAFDRSRTATSQCLSAARRRNPTLTALITLEVRIAAQDDGTAAIEELRMPTSNDPALEFRGCLVAALADERFDVPPEGFARITLPVDLAEATP